MKQEDDSNKVYKETDTGLNWCRNKEVGIILCSVGVCTYYFCHRATQAGISFMIVVVKICISDFSLTRGLVSPVSLCFSHKGKHSSACWVGGKTGIFAVKCMLMLRIILCVCVF